MSAKNSCRHPFLVFMDYFLLLLVMGILLLASFVFIKMNYLDGEKSEAILMVEEPISDPVSTEQISETVDLENTPAPEPENNIPTTK